MPDHRGARERYYIGDLRPSQVLTTYGIGSVIDLPHISVMMMGLEFWDRSQATRVEEDRLRQAVRQLLGPQVEALLSPPIVQEELSWGEAALGTAALVGIPVATFPRWLVCPYCHLLAPLESDHFQLKYHNTRIDQARYVHRNCQKSAIPPTVLPARFLVVCPNGHLDDFPWHFYVHRGPSPCPSRLRFSQFGVSGEAAELLVGCETCNSKRSMADALDDRTVSMPLCRGRHPHLRSFDVDGCREQMRAIGLGATNSWFPVAFTALSIPDDVDPLVALVATHWSLLEDVESARDLKFLRKGDALRLFTSHEEDAIWDAIQRYRQAQAGEDPTSSNLKTPEWRVFAHPQRVPPSPDFLTRVVSVPPRFRHQIEEVVLVERLREVQALVGFTRIISPGDLGDIEDTLELVRAPLCQRAPTWVPAAEVRGEGIFLRFNEAAILDWAARPDVQRRAHEFALGHRQWCEQRHVRPTTTRAPSIRYVLLHSFAHALMRQLAMASGYAAASLRERIYALDPTEEDGPMAGILISTAAADSEGTLGGLVRMGQPRELESHLLAALRQLEWCASDPLCAEHAPHLDPLSVHAAACHACLFAPETSCERGNRFLDRSTLVPTFAQASIFFFGEEPTSPTL